MSNKVEATYHSPEACNQWCCKGAQGCLKASKCACHRPPVDAMPVFIEPPALDEDWTSDDCD